MASAADAGDGQAAPAGAGVPGAVVGGATVEPVTDEDRGPPPEGWAAAWAEHGEAMLRAAARVLDGKAARGASAEDVVGDVLERLINKGVPRGANTRAYMIRSARNAALDAVKPLKHHTDADIDFDDEVGVDSIEDDVDQQILLDDVLAALDELPPREAFAIREKFLKERPWHEVAADLDITTSQGLGKIVNSGLDKIRKMPRFAGLASIDSSTHPTRSTTTGQPTGTTP